MDDKNFMLFTMTFLFVFTLVLASIRLDSDDKKIKKMEKENTKLKQEITEYKWQLEQVPYIIEYGCKGE